MPAININELRHAIPRYSNTINEPDLSLKYPDLIYLRLSTFCLEIMGRNGHVQRFGIEWIPTYFGPHRPLLVCDSCSCGAIRLFAHYGTYACRHCHRALYASQQRDKNGRRRLAAAKLRLRLGGLPDMNEALAPKAKWRHRRTYQKLRVQVRALEAAIGRRRFRKPLDTRIFAYQVS